MNNSDHFNLSSANTQIVNLNVLDKQKWVSKYFQTKFYFEFYDRNRNIASPKHRVCVSGANYESKSNMPDYLLRMFLIFPSVVFIFKYEFRYLTSRMKYSHANQHFCVFFVHILSYIKLKLKN